MAIDVPKLIRQGVSLAKSFVEPAMVDVDHLMVIGRDQAGPIYATNPVTRQALVEDEGIPFVESDGTSSMTTSKLTFLEPVKIDAQDIFTLPDGRQGMVAKRGGLMQQDGTNYYAEVWLGRRGGR